MQPSVVLSAVPRASTTAEVCADALRAALLRGDVPAGARLPPERVLAGQLGVDRGTLRAGLQRLVAQGLLTQRQGAGTVVRDYLATGGLELLRPLLQHASAAVRVAHVADLLLLRRHLAVAVLEALAARPPDAEARAAFAAAVDAFAAAVDAFAAAHDGGDGGSGRGSEEGVDDNTVEAVVDADLAVLRAVVTATGRPVLRLALNPIVAVVRALPALRRALAADARASVPAWRLLGGWLAAPDAAAIPTFAAALAARDTQTLARLGATPTTTGAPNRIATTAPAVPPTKQARTSAPPKASATASARKPAPTSAKKAAPTAAKKAAPTSAKKPASTSAKKPAPTSAKKPAKKPASTSAKKPAPTSAKRASKKPQKPAKPRPHPAARRPR